METYEENKKTTKEGKLVPLTLPLNIKEGENFAEGGESKVWNIQTQNKDGTEQAHVALKESKREAFATEEEMKKSKEFYDFLKNFPGFGKFVPETLYFKAQETADPKDKPKSYCIQKFTPGERIDRLTDEIIYKDPVVVAQLLEFANVSIELLHTIKQNDIHTPDFMRTPEISNMRVLFGALVFNPRYSSNIQIANEPDKNGQKVFFVDVGVNANARMKKGWEWHGRKVVNSIIESKFNAWKKKLEKIHA